MSINMNTLQFCNIQEVNTTGLGKITGGNSNIDMELLITNEYTGLGKPDNLPIVPKLPDWPISSDDI